MSTRRTPHAYSLVEWLLTTHRLSLHHSNRPLSERIGAADSHVTSRIYVMVKCEDGCSTSSPSCHGCLRVSLASPSRHLQPSAVGKAKGGRRALATRPRAAISGGSLPSTSYYTRSYIHQLGSVLVSHASAGSALCIACVHATK